VKQPKNLIIYKSMTKLQLKLRPFLRPVFRWLLYFHYNTHFVDGDKSRLIVGRRCGLSNTLFNTSSGCIYIGNNVAFGYNVMVLTGRHNFKSGRRASLGVGIQSVGWGGGSEEVPEDGYDVTIGEGCWIASGAVISGGVVIGRDSIICAGPIVIRDVPPNSIVGGVPAKIIGSTLSDA
jgi:acetyltransferase-like isoleucine patch superfamily enzyme